MCTPLHSCVAPWLSSSTQETEASSATCQFHCHQCEFLRVLEQTSICPIVVQTLGIRDSSVFCLSSQSQMLPLSHWMVTPQIPDRVDRSFDKQMVSHEKTKKKKRKTLPLDCLLIQVRGRWQKEAESILSCWAGLLFSLTSAEAPFTGITDSKTVTSSTQKSPNTNRYNQLILDCCNQTASNYSKSPLICAH